MKKRKWLIYGLLLGILALTYWYQSNKSNKSSTRKIENAAIDPLATYCIEKCDIKPNEFFAQMLQKTGIAAADVYTLIENTRGDFDPRNFRSGKEYEVWYDSLSGSPEFLRYPLDIQTDLEYDLKSLCVSRCTRDLDKVIETHAGVIHSSLWLTMQEANIPIELIDKMESVFAWTINFYHIQRGDRFKLMYEVLYDGDKAVGTDRILGAVFETSGKEYYAFRYEAADYDGYFDLEGRPMKRAFLKAPVKYTRISSRYNPNRLHPVLKTNRPHLGTDYAAPAGTPIYAVANGVVTKATFTRNNGLYVKIKHSDQIQTQYLHMSKIRPGISSGVQVKQGEVIGYVGKTGLATGNHVCFRFWKNGKQVDPLKENLPPPEPMKEEDIPKFARHKDSLKVFLDAVDYEAIALDSASNNLL